MPPKLTSARMASVFKSFYGPPAPRGHKLDGPSIVENTLLMFNIGGSASSLPLTAYMIHDVEYTEQAYWEHPQVIDFAVEKAFYGK